MEVRWLGHACFLCEGNGIRLLTDPFSKEVGYPLPREVVDVVTVSHDHYDHNAVQILPGHPRVIREAGVHQVNGLKVEGFAVYHDEVRGAKRGKNIIYAWEMDGIRLCHLGDLGHLLEPATVTAIGEVDLLMVPVGGVYTIDAAAAFRVVEQLRPRLVLPMHYKTPSLNFELAPVEDFTRYFERVRREKALRLERDGLPEEREVVLLDYPA